VSAAVRPSGAQRLGKLESTIAVTGLRPRVLPDRIILHESLEAHAP